MKLWSASSPASKRSIPWNKDSDLRLQRCIRGVNAYPSAWAETVLSVRELKITRQNSVNDGIRSITFSDARTGNV